VPDARPANPDLLAEVDDFYFHCKLFPPRNFRRKIPVNKMKNPTLISAGIPKTEPTISQEKIVCGNQMEAPRRRRTAIRQQVITNRDRKRSLVSLPRSSHLPSDFLVPMILSVDPCEPTAHINANF
jgi:hypothetical protein